MNAPHRSFAPRLALNVTDEVTIRGVTLQPFYQNTEGWAFKPPGTEGIPQFFTHAELAALSSAGEIRHVRRALDPLKVARRARAEVTPVSLLEPSDIRTSLIIRSAFCAAFKQLKREGRITCTDESINASMATLRQMAVDLVRPSATLADYETRAGRGSFLPDPVSARTLRRWLKAEGREGLDGLHDRRGRSGNHASRLLREERALLGEVVRSFASAQKPTVKTVHDRLKLRVEEENATRAAAGLVPLKVPSYETVRARVRELPAFAVALYREGLDAAHNRLAPIGEGLSVSRPLERVEMDEWQTDLITLATDTGLFDHLTPEERAQVGLDKPKVRLWLSVAICATTRCILAMRICRSPGTASALETLHMVLVDKGAWADAAGAQSPWDMFGLPELIVSDGGPAFQSHGFRTAAADLGIAVERSPAGRPRLRPYVERVFRQIGDKLMPLLSGRTFSDIVAKGDHDPAARAALTLEDLTTALVRWTVDIYHNRPHEGLGGETPIACWRRLAESGGGVLPSPDLDARLAVFGTPAERVVHPDGIKVFGLTYQSRVLQQWALKVRTKRVAVRVYAPDLGKIMVRLGDTWHAVPVLQTFARGLDARVWTAAVERLRTLRDREAAMAEPVVLQAIRDIEALNATAMRRAGLAVDEWSETFIDREEERLFIGFSLPVPTETAPVPSDGLGTLLAAPLAGGTGAPPADPGTNAPEWTVED